MADDSDSCEKFEERFLHLSDNGIDSDCEFIVGPQNAVIKGHKLLFSAASKVFTAMFYGNLKEGKIVKIEDLDPAGFEGMMQFIYTGEVRLKSAIHALLTYAAARKYIIPALSKKCISYFTFRRIRPSEVLEFYEYCNIYKIIEFEELCTKIIEENTDEVVESEYFPTASIETVEFILKSPTLNLESEIEVFDHFNRWAACEAECKGIRREDMGSHFNNLKKHIRFLTISFEQFVAHVEESLLLTLEEKHAIALNLMKDNSKPMPENLCLEKTSRNFTLSSIETENDDDDVERKYECELQFIVSVDGSCKSDSGYIISLTDNECMTIEIAYTEMEKYIWFHIKAEKKSCFHRLELFTLEAKLEVLAENRNDNGLFENKVHFLLDWEKEEQEPKMIFAIIPKSNLKNECFLKSSTTGNTVIIEGSFNITFNRNLCVNCDSL